jgi:hypothetical protein
VPRAAWQAPRAITGHPSTTGVGFRSAHQRDRRYRSWYAPGLAEDVVGRLILKHGRGLEIVQGGATGIDRSFAEACAELGVEQEAHCARLDELGHLEAVIRYDKTTPPYNANAGSAFFMCAAQASGRACCWPARWVAASRAPVPILDAGPCLSPGVTS